MQQWDCDCGRNPDRKFYVYQSGLHTTFICPGCGNFTERLFKRRRGEAAVAERAGDDRAQGLPEELYAPVAGGEAGEA